MLVIFYFSRVIDYYLIDIDFITYRKTNFEILTNFTLTLFLDQLAKS